MLELISLFKYIEFYSNKEIKEGLVDNMVPSPIPMSWIVITLIIGFGTAYIAYYCNENETPATRALSTIIAFFFSGFYLIYYFIWHVLFDKPCKSGKRMNNMIKNIYKK